MTTFVFFIVSVMFYSSVCSFFFVIVLLVLLVFVLLIFCLLTSSSVFSHYLYLYPVDRWNCSCINTTPNLVESVTSAQHSYSRTYSSPGSIGAVCICSHSPVSLRGGFQSTITATQSYHFNICSCRKVGQQKIRSSRSHASQPCTRA